jgi:hypothetical protein
LERSAKARLPLNDRINAWTRARPLFPREQVHQDFRGWLAFAGIDGAAPMDQPTGVTLREAAN